MFRIKMLIVEIFSGTKFTQDDYYENVTNSEEESKEKLDTETDLEDIENLPELETEEEAEKR